MTEETRTRTYSWEDPARIAVRVASMSGAEPFEAMAAGELPVPPFLATLDAHRLDVTGEGRVSLYLRPQEFHYNPLGTVHGGAIASLLDTAAGCAVHTTLPAGTGYTSLDLQVKYLKPVTAASGTVRCDGSVLSKGTRTALAQAQLFDESGRLLAHATSTCMLLRHSPRA